MVSLSVDMFDKEIGRHKTDEPGIRYFLKRHRALPMIRECADDPLICCRKGYGNEAGQIQDLIGEDTHALQIVRSLEILQGDQDAYQEKNNPEIGGNIYIEYVRFSLRHMETFKAFF